MKTMSNKTLVSKNYKNAVNDQTNSKQK